MVFGVFDGFHEGHRYFVDEAMAQCQQLIIVVACPEAITLLKNSPPRQSLENRMLQIHRHYPYHTIVAGDAALHTWSALHKFQPDIVFVGYDQHQLATELERKNMPFLFIASYKPNKFKSSLLNKKS